MTLRAGLGKLVGAALAGTLLLVAASPAAAKPCHGHGNSEISQYLENVPGPCGDQGIGGNGSGHQGGGGSGGGGSNSSLPTATTQGLEQFGSAGAATARFAEATAPPGSNHAGNAHGGSASGAGGNSGTQAGGSTTGDIDTGDGSVMGALASLAGGGSDQGVGTLLPILLGAILLGGMGFVALRRSYTQ